jgi:hypothetical protein
MKFDEVLPFFYTLVVLTPFLPQKKKITFRVMIYVEIALEIKKEITLKFELQERLHYPADSCVEILL